MRIRNLEKMICHGNKEGRKDICEILEAGLQAADPYYNTKKLVSIKDGILTVGNREFEPIDSPRVGADSYTIGKDIDRIFVFGAGKGIQRAVVALEEVLGERLTDGLVLAKHGDEHLLKKIRVFYGGHPIPDEEGVKGCRELADTIANLNLTERDLVFTVIGNGVSSLMTLPVDSIPLDAIKDMVRLLQIEKGLDSGMLSIVRNQVDKLKGGRITRMLHPAKMIHILALDCNYGNTGIDGYRGLTEANVWLHTLPDASSPEFAQMILLENEAWDLVDESIRRHIEEADERYDSLKCTEFEDMDCRIYGIMPDKSGCVPAAMERAEQLGYSAHLINKAFFMDASFMGQFFGNMAKLSDSEGAPFAPPCALFYTGEMIVTVGKEGGVGGRNQEFALTAAIVIENNPRIVIGSVDTDGTDGPGGHFDNEASKLGINALSGGIVDGYTINEALERDVNIEEALKTHSTSKALWDLDCGLLVTQNISLQDIAVALIQKE